MVSVITSMRSTDNYKIYECNLQISLFFLFKATYEVYLRETQMLCEVNGCVDVLMSDVTFTSACSFVENIWTFLQFPALFV